MSDLDHRTEQVRQFNRLYTREIGVLSEGLLQTSFSLTEARILYELVHTPNPSSNQLSKELALDPGYVSRIVASLRQRGLVSRALSSHDRRRYVLSLTPAGRAAFDTLDQRSHEETRARLARLSEPQQHELVTCLARVEALMGLRLPASSSFVLRPHRPGEMGWVVSRHGALYAEGFGWDATFEALVAEIVAQFIRNFNPAREACWIAAHNGDPVGCVFLVRKTDQTAQLRLLLVEPSARGQGLGQALVGECLRFARAARYRDIVLWTNSLLHSARHIYQRAGFQLIEEKPHHSFGHDLTGQTWSLVL